jgi:hypothetical protein
MSWRSGHGAGMVRIPLLAAALIATLGAGLLGCSSAIQPLAVALAGAGTSTAIGHSLAGVAFRTFTAPLADVKAAALDSLSSMGVQVEGLETTEEGEIISGTAPRRTVEIALESISAKATRIKVTAKNGGLLYDGATATEIVLQTEKALTAQAVNNSSAGSGRRKR